MKSPLSVWIMVCGLALAGASSPKLAAQSYFSENFDAVDTAGLKARGWDLGKNEFAMETGTDFGVATPPFAAENFPSGKIPGADLRDAAGNLLIHPPTADGTASTGGFLISDSDAAGGSDDVGSKSEFWAITPSFSTVGSTEAWFHADTEIESNNNGECVYDVMASIDGGQTWLPMWQGVEPQRPLKAFRFALGVDPDYEGSLVARGYPKLGSASLTKSWSGIHGRWHLKLPAEANNKANVKIRVRFFEPADAWWIAMDNLVVDNNPPPAGKDVVLSEGFETGIPSTWKNSSGKTQKWGTEPVKDPATGLYYRQAGGQSINIDLLREVEARRKAGAITISPEAFLNQTVKNYLEFPDLEQINPNSGTDGRWLLMLAGQNYAMWSEGPDAEESGMLDTPALNLSDANEVFLEFDSEMLMGNASSVYEVFASVDGGANFSRVFTYNGAMTDRTEGSYFMRHYLAVPSAAGKNGVVFRFWAKGGDPDQFEGFWVIDNVRVTANRAGAPAPKLELARQGSDVVLSWTGNFALQSSDGVTGPWANVSGASSPHRAAATSGQKFFRLRSN